MSTLKSVQAFLLSQGFNPGAIDGIDGPETAAAWNAFLDKVDPPKLAPVPAPIVAAPPATGGDDLVIRIIRVFETGADSGEYGLVTLLHDGAGGRLQVTLGIQFDEHSGDLARVLNGYVAALGMYAPQLQ